MDDRRIAADRVRKALAVARSLDGFTEPHNVNQRAAAINRARELVRAHKLDPADFDFPGRRPRKVLPSDYADDLFARPRSPFADRSWTDADFAETMARYKAHLAVDVLTALRRERARRRGR